MDAFGALREELDQWAARGRAASLWWRDDDLMAPTPALDRAIDLANQFETLIALAVIPKDVVPDLVDRLAGTPSWVLVHGWCHQDHAATGEKKHEFGASRDLSARMTDARCALAPIQELFPEQPACFVPPWNRIGADLVAPLDDLGYKALSTFGARSLTGQQARTSKSLVWVNTHVDLIDWRGNRGFIGVPALVKALVDQLAARRLGRVEPGEPTGILSHHLVTDEAGWRGLEAVLAVLCEHPGCGFADPAMLFDPMKQRA